METMVIESAFFADFIKQHRAYLSKSSELFPYLDSMEKSIDEVASDYWRGNSRKWIDQLLEPNDFGIEVTRQDAIYTISEVVTEKRRILDLTRLFIRELEAYDNAQQAPIAKTLSVSKLSAPADSMLVVGYAVGQAFGLNYPPDKKVSKESSWNIRSRMTMENINFIMGAITFVMLFFPNAQLNELSRLQKEENALIQESNEQYASGNKQVSDLLMGLIQACEENTDAVNAQTEAIKENTQAIEQLTEKLDAETQPTEVQETVGTEPTSCCSCSCHGE